MQFKCKDNIKIFHRQWHERDSIAQGVDYWVNYFKNRYVQNSLPIGIVHGVITFSGICCYLAIYKTCTPFTIIDAFKLDADSTPCQMKIILGEPFEEIKSKLDIDCTDYFLHGLGMGKHTGRDNLCFEFSTDHKFFSRTSGSTGPKKTVVTNAFQEGLAVQKAINEYFDHEDVCLFSHEMTHRGVHTTAILPALFCSSKIIFANAQEWPRMIEQATHCQWFPIMREYFRLTPNIKKITIGGSVVDDKLVNHLLVSSPNAVIYDIYGLTECLPPLAIRKITKECQEEFFTICRDDLNFELKNGQLVIDGRPTGDIVEFTTNSTFKYVGRFKKVVRVNGKLHNQVELHKLLSCSFPIDQFSIVIDNGNLKLQIIHTPELFDQWCKTNKVESYNIEVVSRIATSGGIKTVSNGE